MDDVILIQESVWRNSHFSVASFCGGISYKGHEYTICDKRGKTVFECTIDANMFGKEYAIEPNEPCPLVREDFIPLLKKLGLDLFVSILEQNKDKNAKEIKKVMKEEIKAIKQNGKSKK